MQIAGWHKGVAVPPATNGLSEDEGSTIPTPTAGVIVSDFTNSDNIHTDNNYLHVQNEKAGNKGMNVVYSAVAQCLYFIYLPL